MSSWARLAAPFTRYARWLHTRWPAGVVEPLPEVDERGATRVAGLYIVGDLTGIPLLRLAARSGRRAVRTILADPAFGRERERRPAETLELAIVGGGVAGLAAALEARRAGLAFRVFEAKRRLQTIEDFPRGKPIYTYPEGTQPEGELRITADVKEELLRELHAQTREIPVEDEHVEAVTRDAKGLRLDLGGGRVARALRVIVALGRSGNFRRLGVPGEDLDKVHNRLHDPQDFRGRRVLVVGGGDTAVETAIALTQCGAAVTLAHRGTELSRPKPRNVEQLLRLAVEPNADVAVERPSSERVTTATGPFLGAGRRPGSLRLELGTTLREIRPQAVVLARPDGATATLDNDIVFSMIGREAPLEFFRRSGLRLSGAWNVRRALGLAGFLLFCFALYNWKSGGFLEEWHRRSGTFPFVLAHGLDSAPAGSLLAVLRVSASAPAFYYTLAYSLLVLVFGVRRMRRRATPYVRAQTWTLIAIQILPLFLLPEIVLPWLDARGWLPPALADALFPRVDYGHGREFWRAYGFVLAWPLFVYNVFTDAPLGPWLVLSALQTLVLIPLLVYFWGKGAYCGWICSCGALAETLGDTERHKMPHGPGWNRLNLAGQVVLAVACGLLLLRIVAWVGPDWPALRAWNDRLLSGSAVSYKWVVDVLLAGVIGYGVYFWLSGRFWCRFFCPLAALMHIYARFSRFRILADKKRCISCNVCTSVCHQGIDVMNFANKGLPMDDPQCVRCSACVAACPTNVLSFGQVDRSGRVRATDRLAASPLAGENP